MDISNPLFIGDSPELDTTHEYTGTGEESSLIIRIRKSDGYVCLTDLWACHPVAKLASELTRPEIGELVKLLGKNSLQSTTGGRRVGHSILAKHMVRGHSLAFQIWLEKRLLECAIAHSPVEATGLSPRVAELQDCYAAADKDGLLISVYLAAIATELGVSSELLMAADMLAREDDEGAAYPQN